MKTMKSVYSFLSVLFFAGVLALSGCGQGGDDHGHPHDGEGAHEHDDGHAHGGDDHGHAHDSAPETEAVYGDEAEASGGDAPMNAEESEAAGDDAHSHDEADDSHAHGEHEHSH